MLTVKEIKIETPEKWEVSKEVKEEFDFNLMLKKIKNYGFFDNDGKWKEK